MAQAEKKWAAASRQHAFMTREQSEFYNLMTYLLWEYAAREVCGRISSSSPRGAGRGESPISHADGRNISQDLANSVLEYDSAIRGLSDVEQIQSIIELGGGYGRTGICVSPYCSQVSYCMVDIPPALYIAERYLTSQFSDRKIIPYRSFKDLPGRETLNFGRPRSPS